MDETYVKVKGQRKYLYRAIEKAGNTVDFPLRAHRDKAAAQRYFEKAIAHDGEPETITVDKSGRQSGCARGAQCGATHTEQDATQQVPEQLHGAGPSCHSASSNR
ncbi:transposase-like protein [Paraburkholderia youngii]